MQSRAISLFSSDTASPAVQFWTSATCMTAAAVLAPGAVIGIAAFPLFAASLYYGVKGFRLLPAAGSRKRLRDSLLFFTGLVAAEFFSAVHGAIAFAWTHPGTGALTPPIAVTLLLGLLPPGLCMYAAQKRMERGWPMTATLLLGMVLVNPVVLLVGRALELPAVRRW